MSQEKVELADGTRKPALVFAGQVRFLGRKRSVRIHLTDSEEPLVGTQLLADCQLLIDFVTGRVRLKQSPHKRKPSDKK